MTDQIQMFVCPFCAAMAPDEPPHGLREACPHQVAQIDANIALTQANTENAKRELLKEAATLS